MLNLDFIPFRRLAVLLCLYASGSGVQSALAQQDHWRPSAVSYREAAPSNAYPALLPPPHEIRATQGWTSTRHTLTAASQPALTSVQVHAANPAPPAPAPPTPATPGPPPTFNDSTFHHSSTANAAMGAPYSVSPPSGPPGYHHGTECAACTEYNESHTGRACDWFCRAQKRLRSLYRATHRRSECHFEYPVAFPSGCPYGYVEPTWTPFCAEPAPQIIGPSYPTPEH